MNPNIRNLHDTLRLAVSDDSKTGTRIFIGFILLVLLMLFTQVSRTTALAVIPFSGYVITGIEALFTIFSHIGKLTAGWIGADKIIHFIGFFVIALFIYPLMYRLRLLQVGIVSLLLLATGSELFQIFVDDRNASTGDWLANILGAVLALIVIFPPGLRHAYWGRAQYFVAVYWLRQHASAVCNHEIACPVCECHRWERVHRSMWMRLLPSSAELVCKHCRSTFLFCGRQFLRLGKIEVVPDAQGN